MYDYKIKRGSITVVDGDTIRCVLDLGFSILHKATIRLAGINCPETRTRNLVEKELGKKAKSRMKELVKGKEIELHCAKEKGKFGRVIGILWVCDSPTVKRNLNRQMISEGHAREYTGGKRLPWV
jgi:endonuclease YncB( thermonuclease family)|tara:strand:+ start:40 stop:414 length:375 start_codon:yes stop_codon:yes gene_type:complete